MNKSITLSLQSIAEIKNNLANIYEAISLINTVLETPSSNPSFVSEILNPPNDNHTT